MKTPEIYLEPKQSEHKNNRTPRKTIPKRQNRPKLRQPTRNPRSHHAFSSNNRRNSQHSNPKTIQKIPHPRRLRQRRHKRTGTRHPFHRFLPQQSQKPAEMLPTPRGKIPFGQVPKTMEELLELPGVARKTANIVLYNAYGITAGIAVDTHVTRLSQRLGLTEQKDQNKIEQDLMQITPKEKWMPLTDLLIFHGRKVCMAKKPKCEICVLNKICPSAFTFG
jgi:hypothetical protein